MYKIVFKRLIDLLVSLIAIVIISPIFLVVMLLLLIANRSNPFFIQKRPGLHGRIFKIIKFKTMNNKRDEIGNLLPDSHRLTAAGAVIRKTSLDELPQLINVFLGDMSLIGPRPLLPQYLPLYSEFQKQRHSVCPGITGWAQINGRNAISWKAKFEYDVYYVQHLSMALDLKILLLTIKKVIKSDGIDASEGITMEAFNGKN